MRKIYKILFIILLIVLLKVVFQNEAFGVELWVYDENGNELNSGGRIEYDINNDSQIKLYICFDKFALNTYHIRAGNDTLLENEELEKQSTCQHGHEHEYLYTASICGVGESDFNISCTTYTVFGIGDTKEITLELVISYDLDELFREELGSGYYETFLHGYSKDELVKLIVQRSYRSYTNKDNKSSEIKIKEPQFEYEASSFNWTDETLYQKLELKGLELKCIDAEDSDYWNVGETWRFNYAFYYLPESEKIVFEYSQNLIKDKNGENFDSGSGSISENNYEDRTTNVENETRKLLTVINATARKETTFNDIFDDISYYTPGTQNVPSTVTDKASKVLTIITNIGMVLAILMVAIMGIKYMLGSVEEKADYKKDMIPYLVGSCLLFGILTIVKILQQIGESINNI